MKKKWLLSYFIFAACTAKKPPLPTVETYEKETTLMYNICEKISQETDVKLLNKIADSTLKARVVSCTDHFGECNQYGHFLSLAVMVTDDHILTEVERMQLQMALSDLHLKIAKGKSALKKQ